jgi:hypothetical protein
MKYSMQFPDEVLEMPYIGNGERDTFRTYLKEQVAEIFGVDHLTAFRLVTGSSFEMDNPSPQLNKFTLNQWCRQFNGELIEFEDSGLSAG